MAEVIKIKCKGGEEIEVAAEVAQRSQVLKDAIDGGDDDAEVPVQIAADVIHKALEFMKHLAEEKPPSFSKPLTTSDFSALCEGWYHDWALNCEKDMRFELFMMADELNIPELTDLIGAKIACDMKTKTVEEQRAYLGIENDRTEEELAQVR